MNSFGYTLSIIMVALVFFDAVTLSCAGFAQALSALQFTATELTDNVVYTAAHTEYGLHTQLIEEHGCTPPHSAGHNAIYPSVF
jgi:hypothetical protein